MHTIGISNQLISPSCLHVSCDLMEDIMTYFVHMTFKHYWYIYQYICLQQLCDRMNICIYVHPITQLMQTYGIALVFCKHLLLSLPNQPLKNTSANVYWGRKWAGSVQPHELNLVNCYSTHIILCLLHVLYLRIPLKTEIFGNLKKVISDFCAANSVAYCIFFILLYLELAGFAMCITFTHT